MSTRGFTVIEMMFVLFILSLIVLTVPIQMPQRLIPTRLFESTLLLTQMHAMANKTYAKFPLNPRVRFNASGNVNQATTIRIDDQHTCTITLGAGRFYVLP